MKKREKETVNKSTYILIGLVILLAFDIAVFFARAGIGNKTDATVSGEKLAGNIVGQKAPDFSLADIDGKTIKLHDLKGKNVVLFFNEGEMCYPACWNQVRELGTDSRFNTAEVAAYSIVVDSSEQWQRIENQMPQMKNAKILFDTGGQVSAAYGVLTLPSSMHPGSFPGHTYFLIDKEGIIRFFLDDPMMAIRNDELAREITKLQ